MLFASRLYSFHYNAFCDGFFGESIGFFITPIANMGFYPSNQSISILCEKGLNVSDKLMRGMRIKHCHYTRKAVCPNFSYFVPLTCPDDRFFQFH
ncbi:hypothetical protein AVEN_52432-1 [Araneus ventricosus]|uniref:Uncharacterized protein n=1 Tax=Araneus ventricosus TaxID=182803 RepID=A0A4Y2CXY1_ARAVE|nr:hypothetical protein AVEN_52432-1 [Araneus ventricosus]